MSVWPRRQTSWWPILSNPRSAQTVVALRQERGNLLTKHDGSSAMRQKDCDQTSAKSTMGNKSVTPKPVQFHITSPVRPFDPQTTKSAPVRCQCGKTLSSFSAATAPAKAVAGLRHHCGNLAAKHHASTAIWQKAYDARTADLTMPKKSVTDTSLQCSIIRNTQANASP